MSSESIPPWLQEQLMKLEQSKQNLQSIMNQIAHLEMEKAEIGTSLESLKKSDETDNVYKYAGVIMIKSTKQDLIAELEEKESLANTRSVVLKKQEERVKETMKEMESKITNMMKNKSSGDRLSEDAPKDNPRR